MYIVHILIEQSKLARPKENAPHEQGIILVWWPGAESNQGLP